MVDVLVQADYQAKPEVLSEQLLNRILSEAGLELRAWVRPELMRILEEHFQDRDGDPLYHNYVIWVTEDFVSDRQPAESKVLSLCRKPDTRSQVRTVTDRKKRAAGEKGGNCEYQLP